MKPAALFLVIAALIFLWALPRTAPSVGLLDEDMVVAVLGAPSPSVSEPHSGYGRMADGGAPASIPPSAPKTIRGDANQATLSHGRDYLAMRLPRGTVVDIVGAGGKWLGARVNDYGPKRSTGDVADIGIIHWREVCGLPDYRGECTVTVTIHGRITLPATDTE